MTTRADMFSQKTSIGRLVVHCPSRSEPAHSRLRVAHLLQSADFTPPGFPPQAILVVRHAAGRQPISLASFRLRSEWERAVREDIVRLYRIAVRPVRGLVAPDAEAVLFADTGEWLACLSMAVRERTVERSWFWRASLPNGSLASSITLSRVWANTPRFVPAAVAHLSECGRLAEVMQLFSPEESNAICVAVAEEWNLPRLTNPAIARIAQTTPGAEQDTTRAAIALDRAGDFSQRQARLATATRAAPPETSSSWPGLARNGSVNDKTNRYRAPSLPALPESCRQMPPETQRLIATAITLFQAPARARSADFADDLERCLLATAERRQPATPPSSAIDTGATSVVHESIAPDRLGQGLLPADAPPRTGRMVPAAPAPAVDRNKQPARIKQPATARIEEVPSRMEELSVDPEPLSPIEMVPARLWESLSGYQTRIGGVLFLVNLIEQTGLPDCFDESFELCRHISGWGLVELLGKTLLGPMSEDFREDPLWAVLALLDGREPGNPPAASLPEIDSYRMPAVWLKRFVTLDEPWAIGRSLDRFNLYHRSGAFTIVDCPGAASGAAEQAATEMERYRNQGVVASLDQGELLDDDSNGSFGLSLRLSREWSNLPHSMQRWMQWTFPFLRYLLVRALAVDVRTPAALANLLLVKTGTLYCTATHIDLVMAMDQINLPVRRAGLDANPGWLPALSRVVSFHFD